MLKLFFPGVWGDVENIGQFYRFDHGKAGRLLVGKSPDFWKKKGEEMAVNLFQAVARRVPAYKDFLHKNGVRASQIHRAADLRNVPPMDKANYMQHYRLADLCWDGRLDDSTLFSVSSGSSGKPFFWPRGDNLEIESSIIHALILAEFFHAHEKKTLVVDSFSMGIYIAGVITLNSVIRASEVGMPITITTPGVEMNDVLRTLEEIGPQYEQVILAGYPPFVKDIIDAGCARGINWSAMHLKFLFAAENFSEEFREYLLEKVGSTDAAYSSFNIYGSAEASILGHETPLTVVLRHAAQRDKNIFQSLFEHEPYIPTFVQYNPALKFFEEEKGELLVTTYAGIIPLIRYNFHDTGRIFSFQDVYANKSIQALRDVQELKQNVWKLPFLYISGKSDLTISLYGLKIYPENIKAGLEDPRIRDRVSGKFVMTQKYRPNQDQYWELVVELKEGVHISAELTPKVQEVVGEILRAKNLEFNRLYAAIGQKASPDVFLRTKGDGEYFPGKAVKQRWTMPNA